MNEPTKMAEHTTTEAEPANGGQFGVSARKGIAMEEEAINPWEEDRIKMENPATAGDPGFF